jgi:hypothetical protein
MKNVNVYLSHFVYITLSGHLQSMGNCAARAMVSIDIRPHRGQVYFNACGIFRQPFFVFSVVKKI